MGFHRKQLLVRDCDPIQIQFAQLGDSRNRYLLDPYVAGRLIGEKDWTQYGIQVTAGHKQRGVIEHRQDMRPNG